MPQSYFQRLLHVSGLLASVAVNEATARLEGVASISTSTKDIANAVSHDPTGVICREPDRAVAVGVASTESANPANFVGGNLVNTDNSVVVCDKPVSAPDREPSGMDGCDMAEVVSHNPVNATIRGPSSTDSHDLADAV